MRGLIGKKIGMTRVFNSNGNAIPVTVLEVGPCHIVQVKTIENDGYEAVQVGFMDSKQKHQIAVLKNQLGRKQLGSIFLQS